MHSDGPDARRVDEQRDLRSAAFLFDYSSEGSLTIDAEATWKASLLFFDTVAVKASERSWSGTNRRSSEIQLLAEQGIFVWLSSESIVDQGFATRLGEGIVDLVVHGAFGNLETSGGWYTYFDGTRTGYLIDTSFATFMVDALKDAGLARGSVERLRVHYVVARVISAMIAQLTRSAAARSFGLEIHPVTPNLRMVGDLLATVRLPAFALVDRVIEVDLESAGIDLTGVPVIEILDFRERHRKEFKTYAEDARRFAADLSLADTAEREALIIERREDLAEQALALRKAAWRRWRRPLARMGLGIAGASWAVERGDLTSAFLALSGGLLGGIPEDSPRSAYTYLLTAERTLTDR